MAENKSEEQAMRGEDLSEDCPHCGVPKDPKRACWRCQDGAVSSRDIIILKEDMIRKLRKNLQDVKSERAYWVKKFQVRDYEYKTVLEKHSRKFALLQRGVDPDDAKYKGEDA